MTLYNNKIVKQIKNDFRDINNIDLNLQDIISIIKNFSEFSKLLVILNQRRKETKNV